MPCLLHDGVDLQLAPAAVRAALSINDFDGQEDDWYIMQRAHDLDLDPHDTLRDIRAAQRQAAKVRAIVEADNSSNAAAPVSLASTGTGLAPPPGFAGELARFIFQSAPRPVAEVAVVGALGLLAGICGREWNIPQSGLNVYIVLVARSGIGKEAMHSGVSKLVAAAGRAGALMADEFVCFDEFVSGPALVKECLGRPCFVNVTGEIGHTFRRMAEGKEGPWRTLRTQLTKLYSKSGRDNVAGGLVYSNAESRVASINGVAYSLIGESTPGTFFESLTTEMMEDGLLSRFSVIEYTGDRPDENPAPVDTPPIELVNQLVNLMTHAHTLRHREQTQLVTFSDSARAMVEDFGRECDREINATDDEARRQLWNRAHLKVMRVAALLAVGDNYVHPVVSDGHASWAMNLVRADMALFGKRISSGDVGAGSDDGREARIVQLCCDYIIMKPDEVPNFAKKWESARLVGVVPRSYLQIKTQRLAAFEKHPRGHKAALDTAIQTAIDNGRLYPISQATAASHYKLGFQGKLYAILDRH